MSWPRSRLVRRLIEVAKIPSSVVEGAGDWVGEEEGSGAKEGLVVRVGNLRCWGVECWESRIGGTL